MSYSETFISYSENIISELGLTWPGGGFYVRKKLKLFSADTIWWMGKKVLHEQCYLAISGEDISTLKPYDVKNTFLSN